MKISAKKCFIISKIINLNVKILLNQSIFESSLVTFWYGSCLNFKTTNKNSIMRDLTNKYESAKENSIEFMEKGQISAYFNALLEMNKYKRLMIAIVAN